MSLSDKVIARLRTLVPLWWGAFVVWLLAQWPAVGETLSDFGVDLNDPNVVAGVTGAAVIVFTFLWDYVWKRVEHILPPWLTRIVVGSNQTPTYAPKAADSSYVITDLGGDQPVIKPVDLEAETVSYSEPDADHEEPVEAPPQES